MIYLRCKEPVMAGPDLLHYYDYHDALDFVKNFFLEKTCYQEIYEEQFQTTPSFDFDYLSPFDFFQRCFEAYGFVDVEIVNRNEEPKSTYLWDGEKKMWVDYNQQNPLFSAALELLTALKEARDDIAFLRDGDENLRKLLGYYDGIIHKAEEN